MSKKSLLIIMDGWGHGKVQKADAIQHANTPFVKSLYTRFPHAELITCGEAVGLPEGQMGNSEVGHLNIGAGRIVYQELQRINVAIREGELAKNEVFQSTLQYAKTNHTTLHLIGLLSDGGVHSHIEHLKAIIQLCEAQQLSKVSIHIFTDGRDTDPKSGLSYIQDLQNASIISLISGSLVEVISGINFYLYGKSVAQLADFQSYLDRTQSILLANSICESLSEEHKHITRAELVKIVAGRGNNINKI